MSLTSHSTLGREKLETVVSSDGTPIAVWRSGDGPPLVLVHGTTADHTRWAPVIPALEERFTVLAVDRRGRGRSGDATSYALEREYEDVATVVEWAGSSASVLGHSYGGICALEAALLTEGIGRLVLYEAPVGFVQTPPHVVRRLQALLDADERDELLVLFMREVAGLSSEQIDLLRSLPAWQARLAAAHTIPREERANREYAFHADRFRALHAPTLLLAGGDSPDAFRAAAEALYRPCSTPGSRSCPGSDTPRWTPGPSCSSPRSWASSRPSDSVTATRPLPLIDSRPPDQGWRR